MSFTTGNATSVSAAINVTPLIDVLLVLLIIFMVIVPVAPRGLGAFLPKPSKIHAEPTAEEPLVVSVHRTGGGGVLYEMNHQPVGKADLEQNLSRVLVRRQDRAMFVGGDRDLQFLEIAEVIGWAHRAGAEPIGILTPAGRAAH